MIIISGWIELEPGQVKDALEKAEPYITPVRVQEGCLDYAWTEDRIIPGRIYIYERWETQEALAKHLVGENYLNMRNHMGQYGSKGADILKYRIEVAEPVYDQTGTPRADFFTVSN
jgi:quinol monooxygenase YgiN